MIVSTPNSTEPGGSYHKPGADVYTFLLVLALLALLLGILYLHLEMQAYEYQMKDNVTVGMAGDNGGSSVAGRRSMRITDQRQKTCDQRNDALKMARSRAIRT